MSWRRWLVVTRVHLAKRCIHYYGTLIGNPTPGIQWYNFRPPGVTPNRGMGPPWGAFCQITLTSCYTANSQHNDFRYAGDNSDRITTVEWYHTFSWNKAAYKITIKITTRVPQCYGMQLFSNSSELMTTPISCSQKTFMMTSETLQKLPRPQTNWNTHPQMDTTENIPVFVISEFTA